MKSIAPGSWTELARRAGFALMVTIAASAAVPATARAAAQDGADAAPAPSFARAARDGVALRNLGDVQGHQVLELAAGDLVKVLRERAGWLEVEVPGGLPVWVFGQYLTTTDAPDRYEVSGESVNVRPRAAGGAANYPLGQLLRGDRVVAIRRADPALPLAEDWVQVWSPPGIGAWMRVEDAAPLAAGEDGAQLWTRSLAALETERSSRAPAAAAKAASAGSAGSAAGAAKPAAESPEATARAATDAALERAQTLFEREKVRERPDFGAVREAFEEVGRIAPSSPAAHTAAQRLEVLGALEKAAELKAELEAERLRRERELTARQEEAWKVKRLKDPLGARFDGRGVLQRRQVGAEAPRYFLTFGGDAQCEIVCTAGRYDFDLFSGYDIGIEGELLRGAPVIEAAVGKHEQPPVMNVARIRVLSRR